MNEHTFKELLKGLKGMSREKLEVLFEQVCKGLGVSEGFKWSVQWEFKKYDSEQFDKDKNNAVPYDSCVILENMTLNAGIELLWKLFIGVESADVTPFNTANAKIYVGTNTTAESATQTGVITPLDYASMDATFPQVQSRSVVFQATFGSDVANGDWREISVTNGTGANAIALNRKVENLGTKALGTTWTAKVTINALSS